MKGKVRLGSPEESGYDYCLMVQRIAPLERFVVDSLAVEVYADESALAEAAAGNAAGFLREVLGRQGRAAVILASATSQVKFLEALALGTAHATEGALDWSRVMLFHMDEYLGIGAEHPASFRRFMREQVEEKIRARQGPGPRVHYLGGDALLPMDECERYGGLLRGQAIDLCCLGIGENGHLAFNDPPVADFEETRAVTIVKLDEACRRQQVGEGHFRNLEAVPQYALTLTIPMLCSAKRVLGIVPERRKAQAVRDALKGPITTGCPASILRKHAQATLFLDKESASLL